jgi:hypothetical protein
VFFNNRCSRRQALHLPLLPLDDPIDDECQDGSGSRDEYPAKIKRLNFSEADEGSQKTANDSADDADENRDKNPTRVFARHDEFSECSGNETEEDPRNNAHDD